MVIGATALYKLVAWMGAHGISESAIQQVRMLANIELIVATIVVSYVAVRYLMAYLPKPSHQAA
jgi:hypothetical protein